MENTQNYTKSEMKMLSGMFSDLESSTYAYKTLQEKGYKIDDINIMMSDETRKKHFSDKNKESDMASKALEGAEIGSVVGGTVGAIVGIIAMVASSMVVPGLGILVAGPIAAIVASAGAGAITGGVVGALVGIGIPEDRAKLYETGIKNGGIVLGFYPRNEEDAIHFQKTWGAKKGVEIHY
jgi:hypothetical protein